MIDNLSAYKKIIKPALIIALIICLAVLFIYAFINGTVARFWNEFMQIISPIIVGFIFAYLSNPIVNLFEKHVFSWIKSFKIKRFISILIAFLLILLFISTILVILIPSLINTLISFWETYVINYEDSIRTWVNKLNSTMDNVGFLNSMERLDPNSVISWVQTKFPWVDQVVEGDFESLLPNVSNSISHNITAILEYALSFGVSLFNVVKNSVLGIFIAFYMLMSKEKCKAYIRRLLNSFLTPKKVRSVVRFGKLLDRSFGGFIEGQLLDAIVVGIISYLTFIIFGLPVPHLLATIIAVTNVIPIFGPFIGAIPAAFIVLLTSPEKTFLFVILILIIQQIDGNIICPHIIGDKINISSLATIIAIITMGGLFGVLGMLIGVPIFAVIIHIINDRTMNALRKKGLSTSLKDYYVGNPQNIENHNSSLKRKFKSLFATSKVNVKNTKNTENNQENQNG